MKLLLLLGAVWALFGGQRDGSGARARAPGSGPAATGPGPIPGVPAELQTAAVVVPVDRPAVERGGSVAVQTPEQHAAAVAEQLAPVTTQADPGVDGRQTRVSVQPDELPSSAELRNLPIPVRAEGRRLALAAIAAVRAEAPARARGVRVPLAPVTAFQSFIGIRADGKYGRETARWAATYTGQAVPRPVW